MNLRNHIEYENPQAGFLAPEYDEAIIGLACPEHNPCLKATVAVYSENQVYKIYFSTMTEQLKNERPDEDEDTISDIVDEGFALALFPALDEEGQENRPLLIDC
jgi:hypothetical protein